MYEAKTNLFFIGMGLSGLPSCSLEALEILEEVNEIFIEKYTNFILGEIPPLLEQISKKFRLVSRADLEENDQIFLENISGKSVALLIPGDPFIATTHISLRLAAIQRGFQCRIIHNTSIVSAAASVSGLSSYRFGRTVTCPFPQNVSQFPYEIIKRNKQIESHTLVLLDIEITTEKFLNINEAISILLELEQKNNEDIFTESSILVGLAQIGQKNEVICAGTVNKVRELAWGDIGPPQALIVCSDSLHFSEKEALNILWNVNL